MNIIERLEEIVIKVERWQGPAPPEESAAARATSAIRSLNEICIEIGCIVAVLKKGPSEGAILAAEQAYHDAPDARAQVDGIADAIRAAWAADLAQEQHVDF